MPVPEMLAPTYVLCFPHCDLWYSAFADGDAADAVFAEVDAHAFAQADAFTDLTPCSLSFNSVSLADHYMVFGG